MKKKGKLILTLIKFELLYKLAILFLVNPLVSQLLRLVLNRNASDVTFNQDIVTRFLSVPGFLLAALMMLVGTALILFEISVLAHLISRWDMAEETLSLKEVLEQSAASLVTLKNIQLPLCTVFFCLFLPLVHLGYLNTLIPRLRVPQFVIGEMSLSFWGSLAVTVFWLAVFGLALAFLFLPLAMVFQRLPLIAAGRQSLQLWKKLSQKEVFRIAVLVVVWLGLESWLNLSFPQALLTNADFNRYMLKNLLMSAQFRTYLFQSLIIQGLFFVLSCLFLHELITIASVHELRPEPVPSELADSLRLEQRVSQVKSAAVSGARKLSSSDRLQSFRHEHPLVLSILILLVFFGLLPSLFPNFYSLLIPVILITAFAYLILLLMVSFQLPVPELFLRYYHNVHSRLVQWRLYQRHPWVIRGLTAFLLLYCVDFYFRPMDRVHVPWAIGHRGSAYAVENTVDSVLEAVRSGADYAEIDIQLSKDGVPVVFHDTTLSRLAGSGKRVGDLTVKELQSLTLRANGETGTIPTLADLIRSMKAEAGETGLLIELKPSGDGEEMAEKIIQVVEALDFTDRAIYMSLDYDAVQAMQERRPEWWIGYCIYGTAGDLDGRIWNWNIDFLAVEESQVTLSFLEKTALNWIPVYVWTVDDADKMSRYLNMGVSGLITNYPDLARSAVDEFTAGQDLYYQYDGLGYPQFNVE